MVCRPVFILAGVLVALCFVVNDSEAAIGPCYTWCAEWCNGQTFPGGSCDATGKCKCNSKTAKVTDCSWCDSWCTSKNFPKGSCDNGKCSCGSRVTG